MAFIDKELIDFPVVCPVKDGMPERGDKTQCGRYFRGFVAQKCTSLQDISNHEIIGFYKTCQSYMIQNIRFG